MDKGSLYSVIVANGAAFITSEFMSDAFNKFLLAAITTLAALIMRAVWSYFFKTPTEKDKEEIKRLKNEIKSLKKDN